VPDVIWRPTPETIERANLTRFMRRHGVDDYWELVRRSQEDPSWFWAAAVEDMGLDFSTPWDRVYDDSRGVEWGTWFLGGKLNIAWNCVHRFARSERAGDDALISAAEDGGRRELAFAELSRNVTLLAEALVKLGVRAGDRVGIFLPMTAEAVISSHACAHIGAVQVPIFSGFASPAVAQRLQDAEAKVVITADGSHRRGRLVPMKEIVDDALHDVPLVERVLVWPLLGLGGVPMKAERDIRVDEVMTGCGTLEPLPVDSEAPYQLVYTSGTSGRPKGVVHVQGGFLVSIARETCYQADVHPDDTILFATDLGWIMGPWTIVGGGAFGARLVLMEGAPDWPPDRLWRLIEREHVTILGLSPTLARALIPHGEPQADLSSLRLFVTTGEPWNPEPYRWLAEKVGGGRCPIINISGGTEIGATLLTPSVVVPIKTCSVGGPALGMRVDAVDERGRSVRGQVGELVCRNGFPGMTRGLWKDPERYLDTYWRRLPGIWVHGDWASIDEDGYWFLHGRSDDTLNIAGKRIGPAEIESPIVAHPEVLEAAAVGIPHDVKGEVAWAFCVLGPGAEPGDELADELAELVVAELGKAFRPARVVFVPALPKTRSAKIVRRAVRARALGEDPGDLSSVENPEALEAIVPLRE
jgi:acetyl-CoA synthetase